MKSPHWFNWTFSKQPVILLAVLLVHFFKGDPPDRNEMFGSKVLSRESWSVNMVGGDETHHAVPGQILFRAYCGKSGQNPAVKSPVEKGVHIPSQML